MQHPSSFSFVNRQSEIDLVLRCRNELKQGVLLKECVLNFYGLPGIGKSMLLSQLHRLLADDSQVYVLPVDINPLADEPTLESARLRFWHVLYEASQPLLNAAASNDSADMPTPPQNDSALNEAMETLAVQICAVDAIVVLLLDGLDTVPDSIFAWIERTLLLPLVNTDRAIAVLSSQMALRWRQFGVRRRVRSILLQTFDLEATQHQLQLDPEHCQLVFDITLGHPLANAIVREHLAQADDSLAWLKDNMGFVSGQVVHRLLTATIGGRPDNLLRAFYVLAVFREFDINTLRAILPRFVAEFQHVTQSSLIALIKQMQEARMVSWNNDKRSYQIDPNLRHMVIRSLKRNNSQWYASVQAAAIEYYEMLVREITGSRNIYMVEYYYHLLSSDNAHFDQEDRLAEQKIRASFEHFLHQCYVSPDRRYIDNDALEDLHATMKHDHEFAALCRKRGVSYELFNQAMLELEDGLTPL